MQLPTPDLFTHQTLTYDKENKTVPSGVHIGVNNRSICEQAYIEGELNNEIHEWYSKETVISLLKEKK